VLEIRSQMIFGAVITPRIALSRWCDEEGYPPGGNELSRRRLICGERALSHVPRFRIHAARHERGTRKRRDASRRVQNALSIPRASHVTRRAKCTADGLARLVRVNLKNIEFSLYYYYTPDIYIYFFF